MSKVTLIKEITKNLVSNKTKMTFSQLAIHLNDTGHKTKYGTRYKGSRGTARLVRSFYDELMKSNDTKSAENVANAFTDRNGNHSWK